MTKTYHAILRGDRLTWTGSRPPADRELDVDVVVDETEEDRQARGKAMADALRALAERGTLAAAIPDPVAWQREIRKDRPLPGRE